jgi:hypothetical protein
MNHADIFDRILIELYNLPDYIKAHSPRRAPNRFQEKEVSNMAQVQELVNTADIRVGLARRSSVEGKT